MELKHLTAVSNYDFDKVTIAVGGVFLKDGKVLLVREDNVDVWQCPGGAINDDESLIEGAQREIVEEVSIKATFKGSPFIFIEKVRNEIYILHHYLIDRYEGEFKANDIDELRWFEFDRLPKNVYPNIPEAIKHFNGK